MSDYNIYQQIRKDLRISVIKNKDRINPYAIITDSENNKIPYAFIINTREHYNSVGNCFQRGVDYIDNRSGKSVYITDPRCIYKKPGWKVTNSKMKGFLDKGGEIRHLEKSDIARWYALAALIFKINEGDISVEGGGGILRNVTQNELNAFIGTESYFGKPLFALKTPIITPPQPQPDYEGLYRDICTNLQKSPMKLLSTTLLIEKVNASGHNISHEQLLEFCGKRKESFLIHLIKQGSSIMLKGTCQV